MSVIVKGMEMPTCCATCELAHDLCWCMAIIGDDGYFYDSQYGEYGFDIQKARLPKCPLVEIPNNHGRISDMDEAIKCIEECEGEDATYAIGLIEWACGKRTLLDAESEEE